MKNTIYEWTISSMPSIIKEGSEDNVVYLVHWRLKALRDGQEAEVYSVTPIPEPTGTDFTPYIELTKDQVVGWVVTQLSIVPEPVDGVEQLSKLEKYKVQLEAEIESKLHPVTEVLPLPF